MATKRITAEVVTNRAVHGSGGRLHARWLGRMVTPFMVGLLVASLCSTALAKKNKGETLQYCDLSVVVLRASDGTPVRNAGVVLRLLRKDGSPSDDGFQLKTSKQGRVVMRGIPYGRLRIQVIASRMRTFGEDYVIDQPEQEIVIRLERPTGQVSAYQ
jgi:hypothetical protein